MGKPSGRKADRTALRGNGMTAPADPTPFWRRALGVAGLLAAAAAAGALALHLANPWPLGAAGLALAAAGFTAGRGSRPAVAGPHHEGEAGLPELSALELLDGYTEPAVVLSSGGQIAHSNRAARAAFGAVDPGTLAVLRFRSPDLQRLIADGLDGRAGPPIDHFEPVPVERWFQVVAIPLADQRARLVLIFRDQSELRRIDRMRADFIANASHELRTPLATVTGFIETLRGPARNDPVARDRFLEIMQAQAGRMARLIDDLLSLSRLETKPLNRAETVDLGATVAAVVDALRPLAGEAGVAVTVAADGEATVAGSRDELVQVFENILENAIKYGRSGGRVEVTIAAGDAARGAAVTIRDFGPGIAEEHLPRITERFYRVDDGAASKGTGLGLAIVKHIVTRHGAQLAIRSRPGEGAAFTIQFPASNDPKSLSRLNEIP